MKFFRRCVCFAAVGILLSVLAWSIIAWRAHTARTAQAAAIDALALTQPPVVNAPLDLKACSARPVDARDSNLWNSTVQPYLSQQLSTDRDAYDATHYLMVALHMAFKANDPAWRNQFDSFFDQPSSFNFSSIKNELDRAQFLYLASRYLALSANAGADHPDLMLKVQRRTLELWNGEAWMWNRHSFPSMAARLKWKLTVEDPARDFYRALFDVELFIMAIAADLVSAQRALGLQISEPLLEIVDLANIVFARESKIQDDGTWLLQPGVWATHPEYAYAGNSAISPQMMAAPVANIAADTSHSHRLPMWLLSLREAQSSEKWSAFYDALRVGLAKQFSAEALVRPDASFDAWRTTNFLDGRNGVYRWNGQSGYGPFELSATFYLGWWSALKSADIQSAYADASSKFPLPDDVSERLTGPLPAREQNPLVKMPGAFKNGFLELITRLAAKNC